MTSPDFTSIFRTYTASYRRYVYHDAALRGAALTHPERSWELHARLLGIDLPWLVDYAHDEAIRDDNERQDAEYAAAFAAPHEFTGYGDELPLMAEVR